MANGERHDFDSPWKEALEKFLRPFLALCFPEAIRDVLLARFGQVPEEVEARLEQCHQAAILRQWHRQALTPTDLAAFTTDFRIGARLGRLGPNQPTTQGGGAGTGAHD